MNRIIRPSVIILAWFCGASAAAQSPPDTVGRGLASLIEQALRENRQIRLQAFDQSLAAQDVEKSKAVYLPEVRASVTGTATNLPLNVFGTRLNQGAVAQEDFAPSALNDPDGIGNLQTRLELQQPLLNFDGFAAHRAAEAKAQAAGLQVVRAREQVEYELTQTYLQLQVAYASKEVLEQALSTAQANLKLVEDNYNVGYAQRVDVLSMKSRVAQVREQLLETALRIQNASDQIYFLMGQAVGPVLFPTDTLELQEWEEENANAPFKGRSDLQALQKGIEARNYQKKAAQRASLPRLNAFATYEFNNNLAFDESANGYLVGLSASWDIFKSGKLGAERNKAQLELEKAQLQYAQAVDQSELRLERARRSYRLAEQQLQLSEQRIQQAEENLRVKTNRFQEGLEKTTDLRNAEVDLANRQLDRLRAIYRYNQAITTIRFLRKQ